MIGAGITYSTLGLTDDKLIEQACIPFTKDKPSLTLREWDELVVGRNTLAGQRRELRHGLRLAIKQNILLFNPNENLLTIV